MAKAICNAPDRDVAEGNRCSRGADGQTARPGAEDLDAMEKTWMPWRRPGCRGEDLDAVEKQLQETGCGGGGGARSDVAKKLRIARAEKGAAVGLDAKK